MLIDKFKIINYKSYQETTSIQLTAGFNVFIGKNNTGKTALLQALSLSSLMNKPHRRSGSPRGQSLQAQSLVELSVTLTPADLRRAFLSAREIHVAFPQEEDDPLARVREFLETPQRLTLPF